MFRLLDSLFSPAPRAIGRTDSAPIRAAVERVVDAVDPRLRAVSHYRRILSRPVERAADYLTANVDALPEAMAFERRRFTVDPRLRAWFAGPDHLAEILSASPAVRAYLEQCRGDVPDELFAALRMQRSEKTVLGMALDGDRVVRDVPQTAVNFHHHNVSLPTPSEEAARQQVLGRAFDDLIEIARFSLASIRSRREQLEHQRRRLLQARMRASVAGRPLRSQPKAAGAPLDWERADPADEAKLRELEVELGGLSAAIATLRDQLVLVARILEEPERHLRIDRVSLALDHMNIKLPKGSRKAEHTLIFHDLLIGRDRRVTLELIRFPSRGLLPPPGARPSNRGSGDWLG